MAKEVRTTPDVGRQIAGHTLMDRESEKITIRMPERHLRALDFLVEIDDFPSRSEAIRAAIRDLIYTRMDVVMDRMKKFEQAEQTLAAMKAYEEEYLKK
jgi:Arc/MetJ-type ribon-helix-helix transcriptional regulator